MAELEGHGTLYDGDENELAAVAYHIVRTPTPDSPIWAWGGDLTFEDEDVAIEPGCYVLEIEDGTRGEIDLKPSGAADGSARTVAFEGIGAFAQAGPG